MFNDLKTHDILIAVTDGLKGMPEALGTAFPATTLQTCIVHLIRNMLISTQTQPTMRTGSQNRVRKISTSFTKLVRVQ